MNEQISTIQTREVLELMRNLAPILNQKELFEFMLFSNRVLKRYMPEYYNDGLSEEATEMRKDKAWLKEELMGLSIKARHKENNQRDWHMGHEMALLDVNKLIDQLDEPELEEKFYTFDNAKKWLEDNGFVVFEKDKLDEEVQRMIDKTCKEMNEKLVIPQFIADWYEENLSGGYTNNRNKFSGNDVFRVIQDVLKTSEGIKTWGDYDIDEKIATWAEGNEEDFIHLIVNCSYKDGYEVEKEILWEIPLPDLKTSDGYIQYLTYDPKAKTYFAGRKNGRLKQTFNAKDLASVPTPHRHYAVLCDFKKTEEATK